MQTPAQRLEEALSAFRREQSLSYLRSLVEPGAPGTARARGFLCSESGLELLDQAQRSAELSPAGHAASCAHLARAQAEQHYADARRHSARLGAEPAARGSEARSLALACSALLRERVPRERGRMLALIEPALAAHAGGLLAPRARADTAVAQLLGRLTPARHPDAGPEEGSAGAAEAWLAGSADLASEAFQHARRHAEVEGAEGLDTLWALLGGQYHGLFPRPGRYRRLAAELEPWGLRRQLTRAARLAPEHGDLFGATQLAPVAAPHDVRVVPAHAELGLASELSAADGLGRATAYVHASPALPFALRHASAGTVARALGALSVLRFAEPTFLRKRRELNAREAGELARASAAFFVLETRLLSACVLARGLNGPDAAARAQVLCERALLGPITPGLSLFLLTRLSPSASFRGKLWGAGLVYALRERFDVDWFANPHAGDPLRGACARGGDFSVEAMAAELGAHIEDGPRKLSELF